MEKIDLPFWKKDALQPREYQWNLYQKAIKGNFLVVLPTALGKTLIAALVAGHFLNQFRSTQENHKIIMLAPTRPLIDQHIKSFSKFLDYDFSSFHVLNGQISPKSRQELFTKPAYRIFFMTPQTLEKDLENGRYSLKDVGLIVFDEAHRARGKYAYTIVAKKFIEQNPNGRILAITASPGSSRDKILELCENLHIPEQNIEYRNRKYDDVNKYCHYRKFITTGVEMTSLMVQIQKIFQEILEKNKFQLMDLIYNFDTSLIKPNQKITQGFCAKLIKILSEKLKNATDTSMILRIILSVNARVMKLFHLLSNLESQGLNIVYDSLNKIFTKIRTGKSSKADEFLGKDKRIMQIYDYLQQLHKSKSQLLIHPKYLKLKNIISQEFTENSQSRILVFTKLRATVIALVSFLKKCEGCLPAKFVGQASKTKDKGMNQKQQISLLQKFRNGQVNTLIATNVAEEGLDISECNIVIFFDNTASEIRYIQRSGRTGRSSDGKVIILYTIGTSDENQLKFARIKKNRLERTLTKISNSDLRDLKNFKSLTEIAKSTLSNEVSVPDGVLRIQIDPNYYSLYNLEAALPLDITSVHKNGQYNIIFPISEPKLGINFIDSSKLKFNSKNFSTLSNAFRNPQNLQKYFIFCDVSKLTMEERKNIGIISQSLRSKFRVAIVLFSSIEILHLKFSSLLKNLIKNFQTPILSQI
ncbi:MAG: helicase-related protein [Promethearchaeota archaeon]